MAQRSGSGSQPFLWDLDWLPSVGRQQRTNERNTNYDDDDDETPNRTWICYCYTSIIPAPTTKYIDVHTHSAVRNDCATFHHKRSYSMLKVLHCRICLHHCLGHAHDWHGLVFHFLFFFLQRGRLSLPFHFWGSIKNYLVVRPNIVEATKRKDSIVAHHESGRSVPSDVILLRQQGLPFPILG